MPQLPPKWQVGPCFWFLEAIAAVVLATDNVSNTLTRLSKDSDHSLQTTLDSLAVLFIVLNEMHCTAMIHYPIISDIFFFQSPTIQKLVQSPVNAQAVMLISSQRALYDFKTIERKS